MTQFRAIANLIGSYSQKSDGSGILTLVDGTEIKASLGLKLKSRIKYHPEYREKILDLVRGWRCYFQTDGNGLLVWVLLNGSHLEGSQHWHPENSIVVRGVVLATENPAEKIVVEIRPRGGGKRPRPQPFQIAIVGENLPEVCEQEWWSFQVDVVSGCLKYKSGKLIQTRYERFQRKKSTQATSKCERPELLPDVRKRIELARSNKKIERSRNYNDLFEIETEKLANKAKRSDREQEIASRETITLVGIRTGNNN